MSDLARHLTALEQEFADLGGYRPEQVVTSAPRQGGVLDQLGIAPPKQGTPDRNGVLDKVGQGAALLDHWTMGIPTTVAGLVNSAIPGQPLGDLWSIKDNAETARSDLARAGYGDFLALPDAFAGSMPGALPHAPAAAQTAGPAARQAGRLAESAIDPIYQAMPENAAGMFGGKLAKTADHAALAKAEDLAASGASREKIWQDTGWFQGKDGKWRFEIDDSGATTTPDRQWARPWKTWDALEGWRMEPPSAGAAKAIGANKIVGDRGIINHTDLVNAYPSVKNIRFDVDVSSGAKYQPPFLGKDPRISLAPELDKADAKSLSLHELQHHLQTEEGFGVGGVSFDGGYKRLAGEVEARTVQKRLDLTPDQRRARAPWLDYDVPEDQQIVRFGGSGPQMSMGDGSAGGKLGPQLSDNALSPKGTKGITGLSGLSGGRSMAPMSDDLVTLYHGTTGEGAAGIRQSGQFDGLTFFSPRRDAAASYGEHVVEAQVPKGQLKIDFDLPGGRLLSVEDANAYAKAGGLNTDGWTIDDWLRRGQSVGVEHGVPVAPPAPGRGPLSLEGSSNALSPKGITAYHGSPNDKSKTDDFVEEMLSILDEKRR